MVCLIPAFKPGETGQSNGCNEINGSNKLKFTVTVYAEALRRLGPDRDTSFGVVIDAHLNLALRSGVGGGKRQTVGATA